MEHFRPKNGYQQKQGDGLNRPGYYWLAYDRDNLFLACGPCNQRFKRNLFPLANPTRRASSHHDDVARERPLMLHPGRHEDPPEGHIGFRAEIAYPIRGSRRGRTTISVFGLNHEEVVESRRGLLNALVELRNTEQILLRFMDRLRADAAEVPAELVEQLARIRVQLTEARRDSAEYTSMARSALK